MSGRNDSSKVENAGIVLGVLSAVERDSRVTQRHLASELNIALGLANAYLKRCAKKGYIKIRQVPLNRYAYYLTPRGFAEKSRLTAEYLTVSFDFFRSARRDSVALLEACHGRGWRRAVLWGAGELAEVMVLSAVDAGVDVVAVVDGAAAQPRCGGKPVVADLAAALALGEAVDVLVVTDARTAQDAFDAALAAAGRHGLEPERVVVPDMLRVSPSPTFARAAQ